MAEQFRKLQKELVSKAFKQNVERNKNKVQKLKEIKDQDDSKSEEEGVINGVKVGGKKSLVMKNWKR